MSSMTRRIIIHCALPLVAGFLIYYYCRPGVWFVQWLGKRAQAPASGDPGAVRELLVYSGPDFLWSYSLASALFTWQLYQGRRSRLFPLWVFLLLTSAELVQGRLLKGFTFSWADLGAAVLAFLLSYWIIYHRHEKK